MEKKNKDLIENKSSIHTRPELNYQIHSAK
jgi:hypothetical protein